MLSDEPNPMTLDLVGVLSGRDYPKLEVEVYFDESLGFAIHQLQKAFSRAEILGDEKEAKTLHKKLQGLVKEVQNEKYTVEIQSIPEKVRNDIISKVQKNHPSSTDILGRPQPNPEGDEALTKEIWLAYLRKITGPNGASKLVDEKDVEALLGEAPASAQEKINEGIGELQTGSKSGFEYAVKEIDFL